MKTVPKRLRMILGAGARNILPGLVVVFWVLLFLDMLYWFWRYDLVH